MFKCVFNRKEIQMGLCSTKIHLKLERWEAHMCFKETSSYDEVKSNRIIDNKLPDGKHTPGYTAEHWSSISLCQTHEYLSCFFRISEIHLTMFSDLNNSDFKAETHMQIKARAESRSLPTWRLHDCRGKTVTKFLLAFHHKFVNTRQKYIAF